MAGEPCQGRLGSSFLFFPAKTGLPGRGLGLGLGTQGQGLGLIELSRILFCLAPLCRPACDRLLRGSLALPGNHTTSYPLRAGTAHARLTADHRRVGGE